MSRCKAVGVLYNSILLSVHKLYKQMLRGKGNEREVDFQRKRQKRGFSEGFSQSGLELGGWDAVKQLKVII